MNHSLARLAVVAVLLVASACSSAPDTAPSADQSSEAAPTKVVISFTDAPPASSELHTETSFDTAPEWEVERDVAGSMRLNHRKTGCEVNVVTGPWKGRTKDDKVESREVVTAMAEEDLRGDKTQVVQFSFDPTGKMSSTPAEYEENESAMDFVTYGSTDPETKKVAVVYARALTAIDTATFVQVICPSFDEINEVSNDVLPYLLYSFRPAS